MTIAFTVLRKRDALDRFIERVFVVLCLVLGTIQTIAHYSSLDPDGLSYLDMSDAWLRHDWTNCINAYWSPLFPALLAALRVILPRSSYFEFAIVHLAGYVSFVAALSCYRLLIHELESLMETLGEGKTLPGWMFRSLAYVLFLWASLSLIRVYWPTPDMLLSAAVYLSAWLLLKQRTSPRPERTAVVLGIVLALGYWTKAAFFVTGLLFIAASVMSRRDSRRFRSGLIALAIFALVSAPLVIAVSAKAGHFTIGETGRLNYSWNVNENTMFLHWQGEVPASGKPLHPTRKILNDPPMYEYGSPVAGTYPPWYDPSYWYAGVRTYFNPAQQLAAVVRNVRRFGGILWRYPGSVAVLLCFYIAVLLTGGYDRKLFGSLQFLFLPAISTVALYLLVAVRPRYIAPFLVLALLSFLAGAELRSPAASKRTRWWLLLALPVSAIWIAVGPIQDALGIIHQLRAGQEPNESWAIAHAIENAGVPAGAKVGSVGWDFFPFWARTAHDRVVAEVYDPERFEIWTTKNYQQHLLVSDSQWSNVLNAFRAAGANAIVARQANIAPDLLAHGWIKVPGTDAWVLVIH